QRSLLGAVLVGHRHARLVEEQHQEAAVLILDLFGPWPERCVPLRRASRHRPRRLRVAPVPARPKRPPPDAGISNTLICCGFPSSVITKSEAFRPSSSLPLLSLADTLTTTSCVVDSNLLALCCASTAPAMRTPAMAVRISEPEPQIDGELAHGHGG